MTDQRAARVRLIVAFVLATAAFFVLTFWRDRLGVPATILVYVAIMLVVVAPVSRLAGRLAVRRPHPFVEEVRLAFEPVLATGDLAVVDVRAGRGEPFGGAWLVLGGDDLRIVLARARDLNVDVQLGHGLHDWHPIEWVLAAVTGETPSEPGTMTLDEIAEAVRRHKQQLVGVSDPDRNGPIRQAVDAFAEERGRRLFGAGVAGRPDDSDSSSEENA